MLATGLAPKFGTTSFVVLGDFRQNLSGARPTLANICQCGPELAKLGQHLGDVLSKFDQMWPDAGVKLRPTLPQPGWNVASLGQVLAHLCPRVGDTWARLVTLGPSVRPTPSVKLLATLQARLGCQMSGLRAPMFGRFSGWSNFGPSKEGSPNIDILHGDPTEVPIGDSTVKLAHVNRTANDQWVCTDI